MPVQPHNQALVLTEEQYQQGHYRMAVQSARQYLGTAAQPTAVHTLTDMEKAQYYLALAQLKLNSDGCADSAEIFIGRTANPVYQQRTAFALAQYYFRHEQLTNAISWYEAAGIANLSNREIADSKFELAYCYFNSRQFEKAEPLFATIKEIDGRYHNPGNYYYGLLAYNTGDYENALKSFKRIDQLPEYSNIVPYYIAEIYYFMGDRQKALSEAQRLIRRPEKLYYDNELHLLAAQCLFEAEQYSEALPYFEHYYSNSNKIRKDELYEMAYCYYRVNDYPHAIDNFRQLSNAQDSLGQTAMYLLGDCYLKTGDKKSARSAFNICADLPYNAGQREASLLLAGKLSYELGYNDEAAARLRMLLSEYPQSAYASEAKTIFSDLLTKTNNYAEAYRMLQEVTNRDAAYTQVFQKVTYGYAMQQMQAGNLTMADSLLGLSLQNPADKSYEAVASFWKGDIAYRTQHFPEAISYTQAFIDNAGSQQRTSYISSTATQQHAYMNMGYAAMELNDFAAAQGYFAKAQQTQGTGYSSQLAATATMREADAAFMRKEYAQAINLYNKAINSNSTDADYARFQKAIVLGVQNKTAEKTTILQSLINRTPASMYANDARYELALVYLEDDKYQQAITTLQPLTTAADARNLAPKAWIKTGFAWQEQDNDAKAIEAYRHVVTDYPASPERATALDALKSLYIQDNQPAAYAQLLKENNLPAADDNALDSTFYAAAEAQFAAGKYDKAKQAFGQYLQQYPNGAFAVKANYYKAESHYQLKEYKEALSSYDIVLNNGWSDFTDNSARRAAALAYQNGDYAAAGRYYHILRTSAMGKEDLQTAYSGLTRSSFQTGDYAAAGQYADTLLSLPEVSDNLAAEARFYKARSLQVQQNDAEALALYQQVTGVKDAAMAAEARYRISEIYLKQGKLKESETAAGETIKQGGNDYWVVKSYILLSDILTKQKDYFNAKATLQSIIKNTKNQELKTEANKKLEEVKALEKKQSKLTEE